jgi:hypothetical protein
MRSSKNGKWPRVMFPTKKLKVLLLILSITLVAVFAGLTGCGSVQPLPTPTNAPSAAPITLPTVTAPPATATLHPLPTLALLLPSLTATITLPPSPTPTPTQTPLPLPDVLPKFPLDGYIMLFTKDGDLYFRDSENAPVKLTHVGGEHATILSDDGKKVVFFRQNYRDIYSINVDGSHDQLIVKDRPLAEYTGRYSQFIPNTHILLFNTYQCEKQGETTLCATGVSSVDTDTAEIKELVKPDKVGLYTTLSNFSASPDGKLIAIAYPGYIDILDINGKAIRRNAVPYTPGLPSFGMFSLLPSTLWLPDSSGLIVIVPDDVTIVGGYDVLAYSILRYDINTSAATRIQLTPSLVGFPDDCMCGGIQVSPDGNWIFYYGSEDYTRVLFDETYGLYIGDLHNGQVQRYDKLYYWGGGGWGPDSRHFSYGDRLGSVGKPAIAIIFSQLNRWVDDFHFVFADNNPKPSETKTVVAEIKGDTVIYFDLGIPYFDLVTIEPKR